MSQISILMTTYNRANYLSLAIDSLISQSLKDWELIIVDDYSNDGTEEIVNEYLKLGLNIKYIKNEVNLGIVKSRNLALSLCAGKYVAVLDSDDIWKDENKLQKQVEFLENNSEYVLCGSMASLINEEGKDIGEIIYKKKDEDIRKNVLLKNQFVHSSVMYRRNVANIVGGYGEYSVGEDYDLFLKMGLKGKFFNFSESFVLYRKHSSGITWKNRFFSAKEHLKIIKKYKNFYPNFNLALIKSYLRIFFAYLKVI